MKMSGLSILLFLGVTSGISLPLHAAIILLSSRTTQMPTSADSELNGTRFVEMKKRVDISANAFDSTWETDTRFALHTQSSSNIRNYAIVQFIKGCAFEMRLKPDGTVEKNLTIVRDYFGGQVVFQHRNWQIDSDSTDPIYTSYADKGRFALWRWNTDPSSLNAETATWLMRREPPHGSVFATDNPVPAFPIISSGDSSGAAQVIAAQNATLDFKTCLFRTKDLPLVTTPNGAGIDLRKSLWCADWKHHFVYNFENQEMTSPPGLDPVCNASAR